MSAVAGVHEPLHDQHADQEAEAGVNDGLQQPVGAPLLDQKRFQRALLGNRLRLERLVEQARQKISPAEARQVILKRLEQVLMESYRQYLRADQRACAAAIENLWGKYAVTAKHLEAAREKATAGLQGYLAELGYE